MERRVRSALALGCHCLLVSRPARAWASRQPEKEAGLVSLSEDGRAGLLHEVQAEAAVGEVRVLIGRALEGVRVDTKHKWLGETCCPIDDVGWRLSAGGG